MKNGEWRMGMRAAVFNHIKSRLKAIEEIKWVDLDTRQVAEVQENYPIPFPAVLVAFNDFAYKERTHGGQEVHVNVSLNVWAERYSDHFTDQGQKEINTLFGLLDSIGNALHNSHIDRVCVTPFKRTAESTIAQAGSLFGYAL